MSQNWKTVLYLVSSNKELMWQINKLKNKKENDNSIVFAYYELILPFLSYAVLVWCAENQKTLFLFKVQKKLLE